MSMSEWAENEVRLACKKENPDWDGKSFDYGCGCYQSALKAYKSLCEDGHSGFSFSITKNILIRLLNELPLKPIEDNEDEWMEVYYDDDIHCKEYQCNRMSSLFKYVYDLGYTDYSDVNRYYCINIDNPDDTFTGGGVRKIIDEMFPITMPYNPPVNKYKVYVRYFSAKGYFHDNKDYNTKAILYCITPESERVEINKYFADDKDAHEMIEISEIEYKEREECEQEK